MLHLLFLTCAQRLPPSDFHIPTSVGFCRRQVKKIILVPDQRRFSRIFLIHHPADKYPVATYFLAAFHRARHPRRRPFRNKRSAGRIGPTGDVNDLILDTQEKFGITFCIISHDVKGALKIAHRIAMLYEGRIVEEGTPSEIESSRNPIVQQFLSGSSEGPIHVI